jgi:hypothetical protein
MRTLRILAVAFAAALSSAALAQGYPNRTVTLIVPFSAGGPTDTIGRILAERVSKALGQPIVVENVVGAGGTIANTKVMQAAPDGYTIEIGHIGTHVLAPAVQQLKVDYVAGFEPLAIVATNPQVILSKKDVPANNLAALIAHVKANPGKVSFGTAGPGRGTHRPLVRPGGHGTRAREGRAGAGLRDHAEITAGFRAGLADGRRGGASGLLHDDLARPVGAEGNAAGGRGEAERGDPRGVGRPGHPQALRGPGPGDSAGGATDTRGAEDASQGGDGEVVADDQCGRNPRAVVFIVASQHPEVP